MHDIQWQWFSSPITSLSFVSFAEDDGDSLLVATSSQEVSLEAFHWPESLQSVKSPDDIYLVSADNGTRLTLLSMDCMPLKSQLVHVFHDPLQRGSHSLGFYHLLESWPKILVQFFRWCGVPEHKTRRFSLSSCSQYWSLSCWDVHNDSALWI